MAPLLQVDNVRAGYGPIEVLKGIRSMLDTRIEHLSQHAQRGTKVTVE